MYPASQVLTGRGKSDLFILRHLNLDQTRFKICNFGYQLLNKSLLHMLLQKLCVYLLDNIQHTLYVLAM